MSVEVPAQQNDPDLTAAWSRHRVWSLTANQLKGRIDRARNVALVLGIVAAINAVVAVQVADSSAAASATLSVVAGVAAGLVPLAQRRAGTDHIRDWTRTRSASEGFKSEVYQRLAGASAYLTEDGQQRLANRFEEIETAMADLLRETLDISSDDKTLPVVSDAESYVEHRVHDQVDLYYRPKAATYQRRVSRLRLSSDVLAAAAVVLGVVAAITGVERIAGWVPVVTTVGASLIAHIAASRYDHQIVEFLRTAQQLESIAAHHRRGELSDAELVDECEGVISVENQSWMTRWTHPA